jgi:hypothetical protein
MQSQLLLPECTWNQRNSLLVTGGDICPAWLVMKITEPILSCFSTRALSFTSEACRPEPQSSHVMSCHVMSCHVMSCHVMSCRVVSCLESLLATSSQTTKRNFSHDVQESKHEKRLLNTGPYGGSEHHAGCDYPGGGPGRRYLRPLRHLCPRLSRLAGTFPLASWQLPLPCRGVNFELARLG